MIPVEHLPICNLSGLREAIIRGDAPSARATTESALLEGVEPLRLVNDFMSPAMDEVGARFERSEYFVPELLLSARAMKGAMELIRPLLAARGSKSLGCVVIGTVKGDLHDIGKNLVAAMLEGGGFEVHDLGVNVAPEKFIAAVQERNAQIIALSALLTTTMLNMRNMISALQQAGLRDKVRVLIGGAPVTLEIAREIGADGYGSNAVEAVSSARQLLRQMACIP
jgi:5-methyltetrahydrofolate--homocysteine methyltransferase